MPHNSKSVHFWTTLFLYFVLKSSQEASLLQFFNNGYESPCIKLLLVVFRAFPSIGVQEKEIN